VRALIKNDLPYDAGRGNGSGQGNYSEIARTAQAVVSALLFRRLPKGLFLVMIWLMTGLRKIGLSAAVSS